MLGARLPISTPVITIGMVMSSAMTAFEYCFGRRRAAAALALLPGPAVCQSLTGVPALFRNTPCCRTEPGQLQSQNLAVGRLRTSRQCRIRFSYAPEGQLRLLALGGQAQAGVSTLWTHRALAQDRLHKHLGSVPALVDRGPGATSSRGA